MLTWLAENIVTILICAALIAVVALVIIKLVRDKRKGKSSCGCNCSCRPMAASCHTGSNKCHSNVPNPKGAR